MRMHALRVPFWICRERKTFRKQREGQVRETISRERETDKKKEKGELCVIHVKECTQLNINNPIIQHQHAIDLFLIFPLPFNSQYDKITAILKQFNVCALPIVKKSFNSVIKLGNDHTKKWDRTNVVYGSAQQKRATERA